MAEVERRDRPSLEEFERAKMSVWWDFENCNIPKMSDVLSIENNISSALEQLNYYGDISIHAYGDISQITSTQEALDSIGIRLIHVPGGEKDARNKKMIADMIFWSYDNPSPENYLLISGDGDSLRLKGYNILLAHSKSYASSLGREVDTIWEWPSLVNGGPPYVSKSINSLTICTGNLQINSGEKQMLKKIGESSGDTDAC